ncbi:hypothetical protein LXL04_006476 [Taraxacum kok-saghyz]
MASSSKSEMKKYEDLNMPVISETTQMMTFVVHRSSMVTTEEDDDIVVEPVVDEVVQPVVEEVVEPVVDAVRVHNRPILRKKSERIILMKLKKKVVGPGSTVDEAIKIDYTEGRPAYTVKANAIPTQTSNEDDELLKNLNGDWGNGIFNDVVNAFKAMNVYNPTLKVASHVVLHLLYTVGVFVWMDQLDPIQISESELISSNPNYPVGQFGFIRIANNPT